MAQDSTGTKNQPIFSESGAPQLGTDLSLISNYAAKVGNRRVGTTAEKTAATGADVWDGLEWFDTDLDVLYTRVNGAWVGSNPGLPAPVVVSAANVQTITATAWANLPVAVSTSLVLSASAWVRIDGAGWCAATASDIRLGIDVSGATSSDPNVPQWGASLYAAGGQGTVSGSFNKTLVLAAGTNTINLQAYRTTTGTQTVSYAILTVTPLRFV